MTVRSGDAGISQRTNVYAERRMLKYASPVVVLDRFGMLRPMPKNKGQKIKFRRPIPFTAATTPLLEGVTPTPHGFAYEDVEGTLKQYGDLVEVTDIIEDTHEDPVINDISEQSGKNIGRTTEALTYGVLKGGTNVMRTNGVLRTDVNTVLDLNDLRKAVRALEAQKAERLTKVLDGSQDYATFPIEASYIGITHTDMQADIRALPGFVPVAEYGNRRTVHPREFGAVEDIRFVTSPDLGPFLNAGAAAGGNVLATGGANADVYPILIIAEDAYGIVPLRGQGAIEPSIIPPGRKDKSDPLGQRGIIGWKMYFLALILNEFWMIRLESAASTLS